MDKKRSLVETFPHMSLVVQDFRRAFGHDQVKILYLEENGETFGQKINDEDYIFNSNGQAIAKK
jgi:hypothetical protein